MNAPPRPRLTPELSFGNAVNLVIQIGGIIGIVVSMTMAYSSLKEAGAVFEQRLRTVEEKQRQASSDHDLLIEIRQDLRLLRLQFEQTLPKRTGALGP